MKRFFPIAIIALVSFTLSDQFIPGKVLLMLDSRLTTTAEIQNGAFVTGIPAVDNLNDRFGVVRGEYLLPLRKAKPRYRKGMMNFWNTYVLYLSDKKADIRAICKEYEKLPSVITCEPDYIKPYLSVTPNDYYYQQEYHLRNVQANEVWSYTTGSADILVSGFDSGVDWDHPDLQGVIWVNPGEDLDHDGEIMDPDDVNGIDDDGNGYIDDFIGYDFVTDVCEYAYPGEDCDSMDNDPMDFIYGSGHGSHVNGTMTAMSNNRIGVAAINWTQNIVCCRTGYFSADEHGYNENSAAFRAFYYCLAESVRVINLSYGGYEPSYLIRQAIADAWDSTGAVIVAAAGNENTSERGFPADYPHVLSIAALNPDDSKAYFTNYGGWIELSAPGVGIWSTIPDDTYDHFNGTSMASPVVAGCAALLWSYYPDFQNDSIVSRLFDYSDNIDDINPEYAGELGVGRVNVYRATFQPIFPKLELIDITLSDDPSDGDERVTAGEEGSIIVHYGNDPEWQATGALQLTLYSPDSEIIPLDTVSIPPAAPGYITGNDGSPIHFRVSSSLSVGRFMTVFIHIMSETGYFRDDSVRLMIGYPDVLIYDKDSDNTYEQLLIEPLEAGNVSYDRYNADSLGPISTEDMLRYHSIIYLAGDTRENIITDGEQIALDSLLGRGDNLFLSGQYVGDDTTLSDFLETYLHTEHISDSLNRFWGVSILGVSGDTVSDGFNINAAFSSGGAGNQHSFGSCQALSGAVNLLYYSSDPSTYCATRYEDPTTHYKTVFFEFGYEGIGESVGDNTGNFTVLYRILTWFGTQFTSVAEKPSPPRALRVATYPNPFNSSVTIEFTLPDEHLASLKIFDCDGRLVAEPVPRTHLLAGAHKIQWDADAMPSGVYLYRLAGSGIDERGKLFLVR